VVVTEAAMAVVRAVVKNRYITQVNTYLRNIKSFQVEVRATCGPDFF
jgi:hypothetical protein